VPQRYKRDKSLARWVGDQRKFHNNNKLRQDRKRILDEIGFVWKDDPGFKPSDDNQWHQQCERLGEFKRKNSHCKVPQSYEQDNSLGQWVKTQRKCQKNNNLRLDQKKLLDEIGFVWKAVKGRSRSSSSSSSSSTTEVRILCIG
jgi:hypothetical protein